MLYVVNIEIEHINRIHKSSIETFIEQATKGILILINMEDMEKIRKSILEKLENTTIKVKNILI